MIGQKKKERKEKKTIIFLMFSWSEKKEKVVLYIYGINFEPNPGLWHLWHCEVGSKLTANSKNSNSTSMFPRQMYHTTKSSKVKKQIFVLKALCWKQATGTDIPTLPLRPSSPVWTFPCLANTFDRLQMLDVDKSNTSQCKLVLKWTQPYALHFSLKKYTLFKNNTFLA